MRLLLLTLVVCAGGPCLAQDAAPSSDPWFSTFSIIAFDPSTNELGVAVRSRAFAAGAAVVDIRVDDAPNPFVELRRLLKIALAARR
jgi:hypothetical protein